MADDTERLAEIEKRANEATAGPWRWERPRLLERVDSYETVYEVTHDGGCACRKLCEMDVDALMPDLEFIAHAREDIPFLLARCRLLEAERDKAERGGYLRGLHDAWHHTHVDRFAKQHVDSFYSGIIHAGIVIGDLWRAAGRSDHIGGVAYDEFPVTDRTNVPNGAARGVSVPETP